MLQRKCDLQPVCWTLLEDSQSSFFIPQESSSGYIIAAGTEITARQPSSRELVLTLR